MVYPHSCGRIFRSDEGFAGSRKPLLLQALLAALLDGIKKIHFFEITGLLLSGDHANIVKQSHEANK